MSSWPFVRSRGGEDTRPHDGRFRQGPWRKRARPVSCRGTPDRRPRAWGSRGCPSPASGGTGLGQQPVTCCCTGSTPSGKEAIAWEVIQSRIADKPMPTPHPWTKRSPAPSTTNGNRTDTLSSPQLWKKEALPGHPCRTHVQVPAPLLTHRPTRDCPRTARTPRGIGTKLFLGRPHWNRQRRWSSLGNAPLVRKARALQLQSLIVGGCVTQPAFPRGREALCRTAGRPGRLPRHTGHRADPRPRRAADRPHEGLVLRMRKV